MLESTISLSIASLRRRGKHVQSHVGYNDYKQRLTNNMIVDIQKVVQTYKWLGRNKEEKDLKRYKGIRAIQITLPHLSPWIHLP